MKYVFVGPSLAGERGQTVLDEARARGVKVCGPAVAGDILRATEEGATAIALIDGLFGSTVTVLHKEILHGLDRGVQICGAASLGALRAAECAPFGMVPVGTIAERYQSGELVADDAVALVHAPAELGYEAFSQPLVVIEANLEALGGAGILDDREIDDLLTRARQTHYKSRDLRKLFDLLANDRKAAALAWLETNFTDPKNEDAILAVDWLLCASQCRASSPEWSFSRTVAWTNFEREQVGGKSN